MHFWWAYCHSRAFFSFESVSFCTFRHSLDISVGQLLKWYRLVFPLAYIIQHSQMYCKHLFPLPRIYFSAFMFGSWALKLEKNKEYIDSQHTEAHKRKYIKSGTYARKNSAFCNSSPTDVYKESIKLRFKSHRMEFSCNNLIITCWTYFTGW